MDPHVGVVVVIVGWLWGPGTESLVRRAGRRNL